MCEHRTLYSLTMEIHACHFNNEATYRTYDEAKDGDDVAGSLLAYQRVLEDCHGHNFKIQIEVFGKVNKQDYVVDDMAIRDVVSQWDNTNLSVHPDFLENGFRATTELMANLLHTKLERLNPKLGWKVRVWETDTIYAEYPLGC